MSEQVLVSWPTPECAEVIMNRPDALNALSSAQATALIAAVESVIKRRELRVVVLTSSSPRAFCVGADLKERAGFTEDQFFAQRPLFRRCFAAVREVPVPVIAAVTGFALGGGMELALSADLIVAATDARFALPETAVGLVPGGGGTQLLQRRLGPNRAADLIFTARQITGAEAFQLGLVDRVCPAAEVPAAARQLAADIAQNSPVAVRAAKTAIADGAARPLSAALEVEDAAWQTAVRSADRAEGIAAFVAKRAPVWPRP